MLLQLKLHRPAPAPDHVPRSRLHALLAPDRPALVCAPAGYGKTSLVAAWAEGAGRPCGWVALDEGDNDPHRLLGYLIAALRAVAPGFGEHLEALLALPRPPALERLLEQWAHDVAGVAAPGTVVLDDVHRLARPEALRLVHALLEHAPPALHVVLVSRSDPALPLGRLRAHGRLSEVRASDLRFTPAEAEALLAHVADGLGAEDAARLEARTEGWAAGLRLAADR